MSLGNWACLFKTVNYYNKDLFISRVLVDEDNYVHVFV